MNNFNRNVKVFLEWVILELRAGHEKQFIWKLHCFIKKFFILDFLSYDSCIIEKLKKKVNFKC